MSRVEECVAEIGRWLLVHKLKLNGDKTVIILILLPRNTVDPYIGHIVIGDSNIVPSDIAQNLGTLFDQHLNMEAHVTRVCRASYLQLRKLSQIRDMVTQEAAEILVHAFVTSRLDYCNSLLYGLPATTISQLQRIQNWAARIVTRTRKFDHITPVLCSLHWLPVRQRITFKVAVLTYRAIHGQAPVYLQELVEIYRPARNLRSADSNTLSVPASRLRTVGDRRFAFAAPRTWNALPLCVRNAGSLAIFKRLLKTHLFRLTYH